MTDILNDLEDLVIQATHERSHYYVAKTAILAQKEIKRLRGIIIRCVDLADRISKEIE